jgi:hypothetical protein
MEKKDQKKVDTSGKSLARCHRSKKQMPAPGDRSRVFCCHPQPRTGPRQPAGAKPGHVKPAVTRSNHMPSSLTEIRSLARSHTRIAVKVSADSLPLELQHPAKVDIKLERSI